jgi:hypothetical protein
MEDGASLSVSQNPSGGSLNPQSRIDGRKTASGVVPPHHQTELSRAPGSSVSDGPPEQLLEHGFLVGEGFQLHDGSQRPFGDCPSRKPRSECAQSSDCISTASQPHRARHSSSIVAVRAADSQDEEVEWEGMGAPGPLPADRR